MSRARTGGTIAFGGLTPLLDTLFLLLFALLALSDTRAEEDEPVYVELPEVPAADDGAPSAAHRVVLGISAESKLAVLEPDREVATREELDRELAGRLGDALPEEVVVEIRADRDSRHGVAVELLQHLRLRGFLNVHLVASGSEADSGPFGGTVR